MRGDHIIALPEARGDGAALLDDVNVGDCDGPDGRSPEELRTSAPDLKTEAPRKPARASGVIRLSPLSSIDVIPLQPRLPIYSAVFRKLLENSFAIVFISPQPTLIHTKVSST
jgi:hypothetical protein